MRSPIAAYALMENTPNCSAMPSLCDDVPRRYHMLSGRFTVVRFARGMRHPSILLSDDPLPGVRRLRLMRPAKRNALNNELRGAILAGLQATDADPAVKVSVLRGAGPCFSSGDDLSADKSIDQPFYSPRGPGQ